MRLGCYTDNIVEFVRLLVAVEKAGRIQSSLRPFELFIP